MKLSLALVTLALTPFALAGAEEAAPVVEKGGDDYSDVPKELDSILDKKIEFCQNYLGWVTTSTYTDTAYTTKTKTDYDWDIKWKTATFSKGATTETADAVTSTSTYWKKPYPAVVTKTYTDYKKKFTTTYKVKTIYLPKWKKGHGHGHGKRGYDFGKGPDVKKFQRYIVSKGCKKLLKKVYPKTRTYSTTTTVTLPTYVKTTVTKTKTKYAKPVIVPKYTKTVTPVDTTTVTSYYPKHTYTKKTWTKVYKTYTITKTKYTTKYYKKQHKNGKYEW